MTERDALLNAIVNEIEGISGRSGIQPDDLVLSQGIVDSFGILRLISTLEERYGVNFFDEELNADSFASARSISELLARKLAQNQI